MTFGVRYEVWQGAFASPGINVPKRQLPNPTQPPPMIQFVGQMDQENNIPQPKPRITSPPPAHFSAMKPMKPFVFFSPQDNNLPLPDFQQPQQQQPTFLTQPPGSNIAEIPDYPMTEDPDYVDYQLQPTFALSQDPPSSPTRYHGPTTKLRCSRSVKTRQM